MTDRWYHRAKYYRPSRRRFRGSWRHFKIWHTKRRFVWLLVNILPDFISSRLVKLFWVMKKSKRDLQLEEYYKHSIFISEEFIPIVERWADELGIPLPAITEYRTAYD